MECECAHVNTFVHANDITINRDTFQLALFQALPLILESWSGPGTEANSQSNLPSPSDSVVCSFSDCVNKCSDDWDKVLIWRTSAAAGRLAARE